VSVEPAVLRRFDLLAGLPPADLERLGAAASPRPLADGEVLFRAGEAAASMFAVLRGEIALRAAAGDRSTIVMTAGPGELLGWSALRENATWLTTGRAVSECEIVELPVAAVLGLLGSASPAATTLVRRLFGLAAAHLAETQAQLLRPGYEGPITGG
jgi:CRP-like cAMP-binding protein